MKKILIYGIIIVLTGLLVYTNRNEIYHFGKQILKSYNKKNTSNIKAGESVWGIDVSSHQKKIDWNYLVEKTNQILYF